MEENKERLKLQREFAKERERKVRFSEKSDFDGDDFDEDYAPVEIPESMLAFSNEPIPPPQSHVAYMRDGNVGYPLQQQRFYQSSRKLFFFFNRIFRLYKFAT